MPRLLALVGLLAATAGCQARNPYAAFGPATVPPPGMQAPPPYYPPSGAAAALETPTTSPAEPPLSASVADATSPPPRSAFTADASDREPIRIVENPQPAARTARGSGSSLVSPPPPPPATAPPGGVSRVRMDPSVAGASYSQDGPALIESPATGQWRPR
jgi:hypothetical protein